MSGGGQSTGGGAGFTQSPQAFGGLNNTDLRPGRRGRRPVPLLNTSWVTRPRKKENVMRKGVIGLSDTLRASVLEIMNSADGDREALLMKSFGEFNGALEEGLDVRYGPEPEMLAKGLNHISAFASVLNRVNQVVNAIKTGRPGYMVDSDSNTPEEPLPDDVVAELDRFVRVGVLTLSSMVNNSAELPEDDAALERAERAGTLVKIETGEGDVLIESGLPNELKKYFVDPLELMLDAADLGREMTGHAGMLAEQLLEQNAIPESVISAYPDLFEISDPLGKAFPPPKKKPGAALAPGEADDDARGGAMGGEDNQSSGPGQDEALGSGATDEGQGGEMTDLSDDTPQNPLEMVARLATMIVVIAGSLLQGEGGGATDQQGNTMSGDPNDPNNVGLQRGIPIDMVPLAKIFAGEVEVDSSLADALEELLALRKRVPDLEKQLGELATLRTAVARLQAQPAPMKGVIRAPVTKAADNMPAGAKTEAALAEEIAALAKRNPEGTDAAKLLIAAVHGRGGTPLLPPG